MEVVCQKCGKIFSDQYLTRANQKLNAHMSRKNPCDKRQEYKRVFKPVYIVPDIQNLDLSMIVDSLDEVSFENIAIRIFIILNEHNHFSTMPDIYNKHIFYKSNGQIVDATPIQFIEHFERLFRNKIVPLLKSSWSKWGLYWNTYLQSNVSLICIPSKDIKKTPFFKTVYNGIIGYMSCMDKSERMNIKNSM
jgi:hypothetical protein